MPKKSLVTMLLLLFVFCSPAQIPAPLVFSRLTKKEGLASNTTFYSARDKQGFLWIATENGLQRYDGNRFLSFRHIPGNASSIPSNTANRLFIDSRQRLWLLFDKYIGIFNTERFVFSKAKTDSSVILIKKIMEDGKGKLMLFADNKIFAYDEAQHSFTSLYPLPPLPAGYTIADMAIDHSTGMLWFTGKQGSLLYDPKAKKFYTKEQNDIRHPLPDQFGTVTNTRYPFVDKEGNYWMATWIPFSPSPPVLYHYDKKTNKVSLFEKIRPFTTTDTYYEIWNIFQQSNGTIWIHGMGLLAYYNPQEKRFININSDAFRQNGIRYDYVSHLYEDNEKNVWVCTNNGLYRFNTDAQVFQNISNSRPDDTTKISNTISSIIQPKHKAGEEPQIWVSTWGGGVFSYNNKLQPVPNPVTNANPHNKALHASCMIQRRNGEIWIGTKMSELHVYDPATANYSFLLPPVLKGEIVTQLLEDYAGNIWIGTGAGLIIKCENGNWKDTARAYKTVLSAGDVMKLYEDSNRHIWICTASDGLYKLDNNGSVIKHFKESTEDNEGLLNYGVTDIVQYNDSIYLISSDGLAILNSKTNRFSYLIAADDLPAEHINAVIVDKQKRIWLALEGGLCRLDIDSKLFVSYGAADGIGNDIFQIASPVVLEDGRIAIGAEHDFLVFDPEKTIDKKEAPAVTVSGLILGDTPLMVDSVLQLGKLGLSYNNTFLSIQLSTLRFRDSYYIYYMLEGLDTGWKLVNNNEIIYQYLPPGSYTLKLKSKNGEGAESSITSFRIEVSPPFWQTWWFYSLVALVAGGLFFWFDNQRIRRKTAMLKMRSDIADNLHRDINAALGNITILSKMAKMKADNEPEKSKEFIEEIHTKSENMTLAMDDMLWSIDPGNDSMEKLMQRFREYVNALKSQYNVQADVLIDKKAEDLPLQMKVRNDILSLFKGGIKNVIKAGAGNCRIHITYDKAQLVYTLEFDTAGTDSRQLNNLRLRNELSNKLEELDAKLDFEVYKTNAVFVLSIPVKGDAA